MSGGRPRTPIGAYGTIALRPSRAGAGIVAETRYRDVDGRLRKVTATDRTARQATALLKQRLVDRRGNGSAGVLRLASPFGDLAELWLADLAAQDISETTKQGYRDTLRLHVRPTFEYYTLGELSTGRVERFLRDQRAISHSQASRTRTVLNLLFGYALRHDALTRNPVQGTSQLRRPRGTPRALSLAQIAAIREAAARWRTEPGLPGPRPDGQVRDLIEVLLGTGMRPGEALALRPCDVRDGPGGMIVHVTGTVVWRRGTGAVRQGHPKTHASIRRIPVPYFAAQVLRRRLTSLAPDSERTILASRGGAPLSPYNVRRTFREFLRLAGLGGSGITLRWYRRTAATVIARGMGTAAAAAFLGHTSTAITEGHYIQPDRSIDPTPARHLDQTLRPAGADDTLLAAEATDDEDAELDVLVAGEEPDDG